MTYTHGTTFLTEEQAVYFLYEASLRFSGVYLIHAHKKLHHAQHYIGYSGNIAARIASHRNNVGAKLVKAFNERGIIWQVARIWKGETRTFERELHNRKNSTKDLCPICRQEEAAKRLHIVAVLNEPIATLDMFLATESTLARVVTQ